MAIAFSDKQGNLSSRFASIYILLSDDYNSEPVQLFFLIWLYKWDTVYDDALLGAIKTQTGVSEATFFWL